LKIPNNSAHNSGQKGSFWLCRMYRYGGVFDGLVWGALRRRCSAGPDPGVCPHVACGLETPPSVTLAKGGDRYSAKAAEAQAENQGVGKRCRSAVSFRRPFEARRKVVLSQAILAIHFFRFSEIGPSFAERAARFRRWGGP
jgi:hypothetical protein